MKILVFFSLVFIIGFSCDTSHKDATALCGCYTELHRAISQKKVALISDSCSKMHIATLNKLKGNEKELKQFEEALYNCR